jgi:hypothetical protein
MKETVMGEGTKRGWGGKEYSLHIILVGKCLWKGPLERPTTECASNGKEIRETCGDGKWYVELVKHRVRWLAFVSSVKLGTVSRDFRFLCSAMHFHVNALFSPTLILKTTGLSVTSEASSSNTRWYNPEQLQVYPVAFSMYTVWGAEIRCINLIQVIPAFPDSRNKTTQNTKYDK